MTDAAPTWKPVDGDLFPFFKFETVGTKLKGKIIAKRIGTDIEGKPQDLYDIMSIQSDGSTKGVTVGASNKDLKTKLAKVEIGKLVSIELTGTKKIPGKGKPMKIYIVQVAG